MTRPAAVARALARSAAGTSALLAAATARACPVCASATGERVRSGIFGADFGRDLLATLLPFPIFLGMVALIHFGPPWAGRRGEATRPDADRGADEAGP